MGYLGRRIGKSQETGNSSPTGPDVGGGLLNLFSAGYFQRQGNLYNTPGDAYYDATGGVISEYTDSGTVYRAHVFTTSGSLVVTQAATGGADNNVDFLVVGGGGSAGNNYAGRS